MDEKDWSSPVEYDEDLVMVLQDYYHVRLALFYPSLTSPLSSMAYHTFPSRLTLRRTTARSKPGCSTTPSSHGSVIPKLCWSMALRMELATLAPCFRGRRAMAPHVVAFNSWSSPT